VTVPRGIATALTAPARAKAAAIPVNLILIVDLG
jgi:hypothetical protein